MFPKVLLLSALALSVQSFELEKRAPGSLSFPALAASIVSVPLRFITRRGTKLYDGAAEFKFVSVNVPNFFFLEDKPGFKGQFLLPDPLEQEDAVKSVAGMNGKVIRTYTFGIGPGKHITGLRTYNEEAFKAADRGIAVAGKYGVRLIIPFLNNGLDPNAGIGSFAAFAALRGLAPYDFFTNQLLIDDFKDFINYVLNRINTVNGKRYKDDPAILTWQLGNEYGGWTDTTPPSAWIVDIARYIKSLDRNHLVMDGTLAGLNLTRWDRTGLASGAIDIYSNHYYWGQNDLDTGRIARDAKYILGWNRTFVVGEYGLSSVSVYEGILKLQIQYGFSGSMIWSLRYHSIDGGFYTHYETKNYYSYHVPGFNYLPGFNDPEEMRVVGLLRNYTFLVDKKTIIPLPVPDPPILSLVPGTRQIRWFGSAWASSYEILRRIQTANTWIKVATGLSDGRESGLVNWTAPAAAEAVYYMIASNKDSRSRASNILVF